MVLSISLNLGCAGESVVESEVFHNLIKNPDCWSYGSTILDLCLTIALVALDWHFPKNQAKIDSENC
ncbi:MAG TPA: hypothetical protein DCY88_28785 [Cyanobacteria bacterium UBA11372]|nr:hypothetical protein [Cyanobacteria bacterium UBA11372]